jgi:hypothetical protein
MSGRDRLVRVAPDPDIGPLMLGRRWGSVGKPGPPVFSRARPSAFAAAETSESAMASIKARTSASPHCAQGNRCKRSDSITFAASSVDIPPGALWSPVSASAAYGMFGRARHADTSSRPRSIRAPRRDGGRDTRSACPIGRVRRPSSRRRRSRPRAGTTASRSRARLCFGDCRKLIFFGFSGAGVPGRSRARAFRAIAAVTQ